MKKYQSVLIGIFLMVGFACQKNSKDLIVEPSQFGIGAYISIDKVNNTNLDLATIATQALSVDVHGVGEPITKITSYVSTNNTTTRTTWKKIKEFVLVNNMATINVSGTEIAAALGIPISGFKPGTFYIIYNELTTASGKIYDINNTSSEFESAPDFKMAFRLTASIVCPFTAAAIPGNYKIVYDGDWQDWATGALVKVTAGPGANQVNLSQVYPNPAYGTSINQGLLLDVNPTTAAVTIAPGSAATAWARYRYPGGTYLAWTGTGSTGQVFSCTGFINIRIHIVTDVFGDQGFAVLTLQKQ